MKRGFDPFRFGEGVRKLVVRPGAEGKERLYKKAPSTDPKNVNRDFRRSNYYGGTAVADALGCNLRCAFCWTIDRLRNHKRIVREGSFCSPVKVAKSLERIIKEDKLKYARITEGEPTLDMDHLYGVLENLRKSREKFIFILETNGLIFGKYSKTVHRVAAYDEKVGKDRRFLHVRVSIKGATPSKFNLLTCGADASCHDLQFSALKKCLDEGLSAHPAIMLDFVESRQEIDYLRSKLENIDTSLVKDLEWERLFLEDYVTARLKRYRIPFKMVFKEKAKIWSLKIS